MGIWARWAGLLLGFVDQYDLAAITLLVFLEEAGLPLPLPGDVAIVIAGYRAGHDVARLLLTVAVLEAATIIGASILYGLGTWGGRTLLYRFGRYLRISPERLDRTGATLQRRGWIAVFLGRIIPGLRIVTPLAAGAFGVSYLRFLPALVAGSLTYISGLVLLGMWLGPRAIEIIEGPGVSLRMVLTVALAIGLAALLIFLYRRAASHGDFSREVERTIARFDTAALSGVLATIQMALAISVLLYFLSAIGFSAPRSALFRFISLGADEIVGGNRLFFATLLGTLAFAANTAVALIYGRAAVRGLPGPNWLRGLLFSVVPLVGSAVVVGLLVIPIDTAALLDDSLWLYILLGELTRNAVYGLCLGITFPLLHAARDVNAMPDESGVTAPVGAARPAAGSGRPRIA